MATLARPASRVVRRRPDRVRHLPWLAQSTAPLSLSVGEQVGGQPTACRVLATTHGHDGAADAEGHRFPALRGRCPSSPVERHMHMRMCAAT